MKILKLTFCLLFICTIGFSQEAAVPDSLVIGVKHAPPFVIENADGTYSGISIELWENIANELQVSFGYKSYDLQTLQEALNKGDIDLSINPLTVTSQRVSNFDFTQPFFITNLAIVSTKSGQNKWITFAKNFFSLDFLKVVLGLLFVLLIFGLLVWFFERKKNEEQFGKGVKGIWSGLWWSAVTMTTVGYGDKAPATTGGRVVALIWMFTAIIIISGFTASIASALTVSSLEVSIKSADDLVDYKIATVNASTGSTYMTKNNISHISEANLEDALKRLLNGEVELVVYDEPLLRYTLNNNDAYNDLTILEPRFATQYYSFATPRRSELREKINPVLLQEINGDSWEIILKHFNLGKE